jgi:hypothetical protein
VSSASVRLLYSFFYEWAHQPHQYHLPAGPHFKWLFRTFSDCLGLFTLSVFSSVAELRVLSLPRWSQRTLFSYTSVTSFNDS